MAFPIVPFPLPNPPNPLPPNTTFRDYQIEEDRYCRVILQLEPNQPNDHVVLGGQAWEMTEDGNFVPAPLGYASRTGYTNSTTPISAIGDTTSLQDEWLRVLEPFDPENPGDVETVPTKPTEPGTVYGETVWSTVDQKLYRWVQGLTETMAMSKATELQTVLQTSLMRSGLSFNNN